MRNSTVFVVSLHSDNIDVLWVSDLGSNFGRLYTCVYSMCVQQFATLLIFFLVCLMQFKLLLLLLHTVIVQLAKSPTLLAFDDFVYV